MKYLTFYILLSTYLIIGCSSSKFLKSKPIGLINNVSYHNPKFNNNNASNGFLISYLNNTYAITAKHILMIAKTNKMKFIDFENELKEWKMQSKNDSTKYVILNKLLNQNRSDSLTWNYINTKWDTYNDWLIFSIKENNSNHTPLKFRNKPLKTNELLYAVGWSYKDSIGEQRLYKYKFKKTENNYHSLVEVSGPESLGGLSGAPVVDIDGKVVGLVSSGWKDETTNETWLQITRIRNIKAFLNKQN